MSTNETGQLLYEPLLIESVSHLYETTLASGLDAATRFPLSPNDVWDDYDAVPSVPPAGLVANQGPVPGGGPVELVRLIVNPKTANRLQWAENPSTAVPMYMPPGLKPSIRSVVPATFGAITSYVIGPYQPTLQDLQNSQFVPYDGHTWVVDSLNHVVEFPGGLPSSVIGNTLVLTFYRYTGPTGGSGGGIGGSVVARNVGTGAGLVVANSTPPNLYLRQIGTDPANGGITVSTVSNDILIGNTLSGDHQGATPGAGEIFLSKRNDRLVFRRIRGTGSVSVSYDQDGAIVITGTGGPGGGGTLLTLANLTPPGPVTFPVLGWWRDLGAGNTVANLRSLVVDDTSGIYALVTDSNTAITLYNTLEGMNVGSGTGEVYKAKVNDRLQFRRISAGGGVAVTQSGDQIIISAGGAASGVQTFVNVGAADAFSVGVCAGVASGTTAGFYRLRADAASGLGIAFDGVNSRINFTNTLVGANVGGGAEVYRRRFDGVSPPQLEFRTLRAGSGVQLDVDNMAFPNTITISASSAGSGINSVIPSTSGGTNDIALVDGASQATGTAHIRRLRALDGIEITAWGSGVSGDDYVTIKATGAVSGAVTAATGSGDGSSVVSGVGGGLLTLRNIKAGAGIVVDVDGGSIRIGTAPGGASGIIGVASASVVPVPSGYSVTHLVDLSTPQTSYATMRLIGVNNDSMTMSFGGTNQQLIQLEAKVPVRSVAPSAVGQSLYDGLYAGGAATLVGLLAGTGISIIPGGGSQSKTLTISASGAVTGAITLIQPSTPPLSGTSASLVDTATQSSLARIRRLVAGPGVTLTEGNSGSPTGGDEYVVISAGGGGGGGGGTLTSVVTSDLDLGFPGTDIVDSASQTLGVAKICRLVAGGGITIGTRSGSSGSEYVTISATGLIANAVLSVNSFPGPDVSLIDPSSTPTDRVLRQLRGAGGITVTTLGAPGDPIEIIAPAPSTVQETAVGGTSLFSHGGSTSRVMRQLLAAPNIALDTTTTPGGIIIQGANIVDGVVPPFYSGSEHSLIDTTNPLNVVVRQLVADAGINITNDGGVCVISTSLLPFSITDSGAVTSGTRSLIQSVTSTTGTLRKIKGDASITVDLVTDGGGQYLQIGLAPGVAGTTVSESFAVTSPGSVESLMYEPVTLPATATFKKISTTVNSGVAIATVGGPTDKTIQITGTGVLTVSDAAMTGVGLVTGGDPRNPRIRTLTGIAPVLLTAIPNGVQIELNQIISTVTESGAASEIVSGGGIVSMKDSISNPGLTDVRLKKVRGSTGIVVSTGGTPANETIDIACTVVGGTTTMSGFGIPLLKVSGSSAVVRGLLAGPGIAFVNTNPDVVEITTSGAGSAFIWGTAALAGVTVLDPLALGYSTNGSFLFNPVASPTTETAGSRMYYNPSPGAFAFRVGEVNGTQWAASNRGICTIGMGYNTQVSTSYSTVTGGQSNIIGGTTAPYQTGSSCVIAGGNINKIGINQPCQDCVISGGNLNSIGSETGSILAQTILSCGILSGTSNAISQNAVNGATMAGCVIVGGTNNLIGSRSTLDYGAGRDNSITGGRSNTIQAGSGGASGAVNYSTICSGRGHAIRSTAAFSSDYNVIVGGGGTGVNSGNYIGGYASAVTANIIGGGSTNRINNGNSTALAIATPATVEYCTLAGGLSNEIGGANVTNTASTISGGMFNRIGLGYGGICNTVAGGYLNVINASSGDIGQLDFCVVGGGQDNLIRNTTVTTMANQTIAGGTSNRIGGGVFSTANSNNSIGGGTTNMIGVVRSTGSCLIGGGDNNSINSTGTCPSAVTNSVIVGGISNKINGGNSNGFTVSCSIGGGNTNSIGVMFNCLNATISGGTQNTIGTYTNGANTAATFTGTDNGSCITGGSQNHITGAQVISQYNVITGGYGNIIGSRQGMQYCSILGGSTNWIGYSGTPTENPNSPSNSSLNSTIVGGSTNKICTLLTSIGSTSANTILGGQGNTLFGGGWNAVLNGFGNTIGQVGSNQPYLCTIGCGRNINVSYATTTNPFFSPDNPTYAAGYNVTVNHPGNWIWSQEGGDPALAATVDPNSFTVNIAGTIRMCSVGAGVQLTPNSNAWSTISDWTTKKSVTLLDCDRVLAGLAQLPLYEYEYRSTKNGHKNFGPMAQDWAALMPVTETQVGSVVSMDVMALAATKALHAQVTAQAAAIAELQAALASLQAALAALRPGSA